MLDDNQKMLPTADDGGTRAQIEARILQLKEDIKSLETSLNTLVPIAQLPAEILSKIFLTYQAMCREQDHYRYDALTENLEWFRVGHVSRHWRQVALHLPALWANIQISSKRNHSFSRMQLERSKNHLLSVHARLSNTSETSNVDAMSLPHPSRLKRLVLHRDADSDSTDRVLLALTEPADGLEFLVIGPFCTIPQDLFAGETPHLHHLELRLCTDISWNSTLLRSEHISHLDIQLLPKATLPSWSQLRSVLRSVENSLRVLHLSNALPAKEDSCPSLPIQLARVSELGLSGYDSPIPVAIMASFLKLVQVPASASQSLQVMIIEDAHVEFQELIGALASSRAAATPDLKFLAVRSDRSGNDGRMAIYFRGWIDNKVARSSYSYHPIGLPTADLTLNFGFEPDHVDEFFPVSSHNAIPGISLNQLETLIVTSPQYASIPATFWDNVSRLPKLKSIRINRFYDYFVRCLSEDSTAIMSEQSALLHGKAAPHPTERRFVSLKSIYFDWIEDFPTSEFFAVLTKNIRLRQSIGKPFESVQFDNCELSTEQFNVLSRLGVTFDSQTLRSRSGSGTFGTNSASIPVQQTVSRVST